MRLIDADALLQTLSDMCCADNNVKTRQIVDSTLHNLMPQIISDEPTVDAQPVKHGSWIEVRKHRDADGCIVTDYKCSECEIMLRDTNPDDRDSEFYCYHCGAKMEV